MGYGMEPYLMRPVRNIYTIHHNGDVWVNIGHSLWACEWPSSGSWYAFVVTYDDMCLGRDLLL